MRYALIREMDVSNGVGVGISLFVQGCHFHCNGCFNPETWDFSGGKEWTPEIEEKFIAMANKPYIQRISILGGEPLADENVHDVMNLLLKLKRIYPNKQIWLYTGYTWESIQATYRKDIERCKAVSCVDVLVDGQFQLDKQDTFNREIIFAGSTNQRIIDVPQSLANKGVILCKKAYK